jgi:hypothetical protein
MKGIVLGIILSFVGSGVAAGFQGYLEPLRGIQDTLNDESRLFDSNSMDGFGDLQKDIEYRKQVMAEEEHHKQLMEEEYLRHKDGFRADHEYFLNHPSIEHPKITNNSILEKHVSKPRPLPTGRTLYVGGSKPGNYTKIQDAIDNASDGDTVFMYSGRYNESIFINKSIVVCGQERNTTFIEGGANPYTFVRIVGANVVFKRFRIETSWWSYSWYLFE